MRAIDIECPRCGAKAGAPCGHLQLTCFDRVLAASSIGQGLANIKKNGIADELRKLERGIGSIGVGVFKRSREIAKEMAMNEGNNACPTCFRDLDRESHAETCPIPELSREMMRPLPKTQRERERFGLDEIERGPKVIK